MPGDRKNATPVWPPASGHRADPGPPRGLLQAQVGPGRFHHARLPPSPALSTWVQHYWSVRWDLSGLPARQQASLPHPNVHWVVEAGCSVIHGVHRGRFERVLAGVGGVFGIKFRPAAFRPFLAAAVSRLTGCRLAPEQVFGAEALAYHAAVLTSPDDEARVACAEAFLQAHRPAPDPRVDWLGAVVDAIAEDRSLTRVEQLVERSGRSLRVLQRLFREYVGVGPKWVINRYRLHEAIELLRQGRSLSWTGLALELGYFDQAHFQRDFRALVGRTPAQFERDCASSAPSAVRAAP